jgi:hypothetical protein
MLYGQGRPAGAHERAAQLCQGALIAKPTHGKVLQLPPIRSGSASKARH